MKKVALIISGTGIARRWHILDIALTRYEHLEQFNAYHFDIYIFKCEYKRFRISEWIKGSNCTEKIHLFGHDVTLLKHTEFESTNKWISKLLNLYYRISKKRLADWEWQKDFSKIFHGYDLITTHFNDAAILAEAIWEKYKIPYCATWHGSDIHTIPFNNTAARVKTIACIEHAAQNFFVSNALKEQSDKLTKKGNKIVLYNGINFALFKRYSDDKRNQLRKELGAGNRKVVTFAGTLRDIKNAKEVPNIFLRISELSDYQIVFWIIGDGGLRKTINDELHSTSLDTVFWGIQPADKMPDYFNCTDVLIIPSLKEGLGMVGIEALACGANAIGSNVGGLKEAIGEDFCIPLDESFTINIAKRAANLLTHPIPQSSPAMSSWNEIARQELSTYNSILQ